MNASSAQKNQEKGLKILEKSLGKYMPIRSFETKDEFDKLFEDIEELLIDVTEGLRLRPSNKEKQKEYYSGKKKPIHSKAC